MLYVDSQLSMIQWQTMHIEIGYHFVNFSASLFHSLLHTYCPFGSRQYISSLVTFLSISTTTTNPLFCSLLHIYCKSCIL